MTAVLCVVQKNWRSNSLPRSSQLERCLLVKIEQRSPCKVSYCADTSVAYDRVKTISLSKLSFMLILRWGSVHYFAFTS